MFDWLTYEHKTVRAVRGSGRKAMEKLSAEGWELVSQQSGALRKTIEVRRIRFVETPHRFTATPPHRLSAGRQESHEGFHPRETRAALF